jgi:hypothetical protein
LLIVDKKASQTLKLDQGQMAVRILAVTKHVFILKKVRIKRDGFNLANEVTPSEGMMRFIV